MARQLLVVGSARTVRKLAEQLASDHDVVTCSDPERAMALAAAGTFLAIVQHVDFPQLATDTPVVRVGDRVGPEVLAELASIRQRVRLDQRERAATLRHLASLSYDEYVTLAKARATRDYLLALLRRHQGVVAEAAREAGMLRETLHRLIRRHDVDPDWFRETSE
jgi:DNA-binding NtrC family response regulator